MHLKGLANVAIEFTYFKSLSSELGYDLQKITLMITQGLS